MLMLKQERKTCSFEGQQVVFSQISTYSENTQNQPHGKLSFSLHTHTHTSLNTKPKIIDRQAYKNL